MQADRDETWGDDCTLYYRSVMTMALDILKDPALKDYISYNVPECKLDGQNKPIRDGFMTGNDVSSAFCIVVRRCTTPKDGVVWRCKTFYF